MQAGSPELRGLLAASEYGGSRRARGREGREGRGSCWVMIRPTPPRAPPLSQVTAPVKLRPESWREQALKLQQEWQKISSRPFPGGAQWPPEPFPETPVHTGTMQGLKWKAWR